MNIVPRHHVSQSARRLPFLQRATARLCSLFVRAVRWVVRGAQSLIKSYGRAVYRRLPLSQSQKTRLLHCAFRLMPEVFVGRPDYETWAYGWATVRLQDVLFPDDLQRAKKIMIFIVPEHNAMSGGIYSIFSIAYHMWRLRWLHGHEVAVMTRPTHGRLTYFRNQHFRNSENVFRFDQISRCKAAREVYLHIPEYAAPSFVDDLTAAERTYLQKLDKLHINILNQNIKLMPEAEKFAGLREFCPSLSQSVAHHAYYSQEMADKYCLPTFFMPAYTDLSNYPPSHFDQKEKLIIYSLDDAPYKNDCLKQIALEFPEFELVEIRGITFDRFMDYATRCMFSITFGEGFDGYLAQPIHQGGIGFAVYNDDFFPSPDFKKYDNIFESPDQMVTEICARMRRLLNDRAAYETLNAQFVAEYDKLYSLGEYIDQIKKLSLRQSALMPHAQKDKAANLRALFAQGAGKKNG